MKSVLLVTIGFSPNIGGIETHFDDLVSNLTHRKWKVFVLTYKPLNANVNIPMVESDDSVTIYRLPIVKDVFYKLIHQPALEFFYLVPGLFIGLLVFLLLKGRQISVIHSHGLAAGFVSVVWGSVFRKRVVTTTHSIYNFPTSGLYPKLAKYIFASSKRVLTLSKQSRQEIIKLGVEASKVAVFTYWINLKVFKKIKDAKKKVGWTNRFIVLFVGRLIEEKGVQELLEASALWDSRITAVFIGTGPLEGKIREFMSKQSNIVYLGSVANSRLPVYYSAADLIIVPSVHEEGFGRVILEALSCGTPVVGSNRGAIPEAMDESVGKLITVTPFTIKSEVEHLFNNRRILFRLANHTRSYAQEHFSDKNIDTIIDAYQ